MAAVAHLLLLLAVTGVVLHQAAAHIKEESFEDDARAHILLEKFGFTGRGWVSIAVNASVLKAGPDPALIGFFLLFDGMLLSEVIDKTPELRLSRQAPEPYRGCILSSLYVQTLFTFECLDGNGHYSRTFPVTHAGEYSLFFANCAPRTRVTMDVRTELYNSNPDGSRDYLSFGQGPVPTVYSFFAVCYASFLSAWLHRTLVRNRLSVRPVHHLMSGLLAVLMLYCLSAAEDRQHTHVTGTAHGWDTPFFALRLVKGAMLFPVVTLIGAGWSLLEPFLPDRERKVLMAVVPLQVAMEIATTVVGEYPAFVGGGVTWTWKHVFSSIQFAGCCAVFLLMVRTIRTLREVSETDDKAARRLSNLQLFCQLYVAMMVHLYFTGMVVVHLKFFNHYSYQWASVAAEEVATIVFYVFMFYKFRPAESFPLEEVAEELTPGGV